MMRRSTHGIGRATWLPLMVVAALIVAVWTTGIATAAPPFAPLLAGPPPTVVNYQGVVQVGGVAFTGSGHFKFAIVNAAGNTTYWSNDGTSAGGGEPTQAVALTVTNGLFNVLLGDTSVAGMSQPLTEAAFAESNTYLRVWFSQNAGGPFEQLSPDQPIASVPYALRAKTADNPGPSGPQGPTGPTGAAGAAGPSGPAGATGPTGPCRPRRARMAQPAPPDRPSGPPGATGATGLAGPGRPRRRGGCNRPPPARPAPHGADGATGPTGPAGATGADGATGPTGTGRPRRAQLERPDLPAPPARMAQPAPPAATPARLAQPAPPDGPAPPASRWRCSSPRIAPLCR